MRVIFMGTPDFASHCLERLYDDGFEIAAVFTQPDKPKNRGHKLTPSPVKELAVLHGTDVYQPDSLKDGCTEEIIKNLSPDVIVAVAYGKLLPVNILNIPPKGCVNIHGSMLPFYRGSAPIQWAVLNGDKSTGVTSMFMAEEMDAGDIIDCRKTEIGENETAGELYERLSYVGAELLSDTLRAIESGTAKRTAQDDSLATYAPPLKKEMSPIDFNMNADKILSQIKGLNPWPVATAEISGSLFRIYSAEKCERKSDNPGTVSQDKKGIRISCSDGDIIITELQVAGGKRMKAVDYLRGHPLDI